MSQIIPLTSFETRHSNVISWVNEKLSVLGLEVRPSFDLQIARSAHPGCTCPHHGTDKCDCQIVVLLVYGEQGSPVTLVVHSRDGKTSLSITESPHIGEDISLAGQIVNALNLQKSKI